LRYLKNLLKSLKRVIPTDGVAFKISQMVIGREKDLDDIVWAVENQKHKRVPVTYEGCSAILAYLKIGIQSCSRPSTRHAPQKTMNESNPVGKALANLCAHGTALRDSRVPKSTDNEHSVKFAVSVNVSTRKKDPHLKLAPAPGDCTQGQWSGSLFLVELLPFCFSLQACGQL
jgi:hypothetical protein